VECLSKAQRAASADADEGTDAPTERTGSTARIKDQGRNMPLLFSAVAKQMCHKRATRQPSRDQNILVVTVQAHDLKDKTIFIEMLLPSITFKNMNPTPISNLTYADRAKKWSYPQRMTIMTFVISHQMSTQNGKKAT
jgi:hypothetical protein